MTPKSRSFHWRKGFLAVLCCLGWEIPIVGTSCIFQRVAVNGTFICLHFDEDQSLGTMHTSIKYANPGSNRGAGNITNPARAKAFHRPVFLWWGDTDNSRNKLLEHILQPLKVHSPVLVLFKCTLHKLRRRKKFDTYVKKIRWLMKSEVQGKQKDNC